MVDLRYVGFCICPRVLPRRGRCCHLPHIRQCAMPASSRACGLALAASERQSPCVEYTRHPPPQTDLIARET
jgi:hypothetical protein